MQLNFFISQNSLNDLNTCIYTFSPPIPFFLTLSCSNTAFVLPLHLNHSLQPLLGKSNRHAFTLAYELHMTPLTTLFFWFSGYHMVLI